MANFINNESDDDSFTLSAAAPRHLNTSNYFVLNATTSMTAFTGAQFSGVTFFAFDASNAQIFLNGGTASGYILNPNGQVGLANVTIPVGTWYIGAQATGLSGNQTVAAFDEVSHVTLTGSIFVGNVPLAVSGGAGAWAARGFTVSGSPAEYVETEASGGKFMIMNDAQFSSFQSANVNGYNGGGYSYTYAQGGQNGGPATELEGEAFLPAGHWNMVWINDTAGWAGGAANLSGFSSSSNGQIQSGTSSGGQGGSGTPTQSSPTKLLASDFNNDSTSDILLQNSSTVVDWIVKGGNYQNGNVLTTGAAGYKVVGTGDFNADGTTDVLLQNSGTVVDWIIKNGAYQSGNVITTGAAGYTVVGTGDFNADSTSDVLLQSGGTVVDWIMKNGVYQSGNVITTGATGYNVVGVGDFNGDGTSDILLQSGGTVVEWIMKNGAYQSGSVLTTGAAGYQVVGTGDFNGDGTSDVLLQNGGTVVDWIMKNGAYQTGNVITTAAIGFNVVGSGDYNGDGTSDVLLQNGGTVVDWLMKNGAYQSGNVITTGATGYTVTPS